MSLDSNIRQYQALIICNKCVHHAETNDGAILFVFGDEAAVTAAQQKEKAEKPAEQAAPAAEEPSSVPEAVISTPPPEEAAPEPEAAYEAARAEQVVEAAAGVVVLHALHRPKLKFRPACSATHSLQHSRRACRAS